MDDRMIDDRLNDTEILEELGRRLRRERLDRDLTVESVANRAGIAERTVRNVEEGRPFSISTLLAILRVYGLVDRIDAFLPDRGPSPIQLADNAGKVRRRASKRPEAEWEW